ncbi:MAG TPA: DUF58 domain-containing protein [Edaphocola sp.]|nr:DUF58 domain-containing protein [Edaphocola sp.]
MSGFFINNRWFLALGIIAVISIFAFFLPAIWFIVPILIIVFSLLTIVDFIALFIGKKNVIAKRTTAERWHLGESNAVNIFLKNNFPFAISIEVIDEIPVIFQKRNFILYMNLARGAQLDYQYELIPFNRGELNFGNINVFISSPFKLLKKRIKAVQETIVKVYPTTKLLKNYQLMAVTDQHGITGSRKIRRLGHSLEFEQIKYYVTGDDIRTINWKATARTGELMVNNYTDIRSQQIYCLIDKGRSMKMPFEGMTLMDHAIKASLVFLNIALHKHDKAGLISFSSTVNDIIPADQGPKQMQKILDTLYNQRTDFQDSDFGKLFVHVKNKINQRSFLMLFTNFESLAALERQMPYLRNLANKYMLCVAFFENTAVDEIIHSTPDTLEGIYKKTVAERFSFERKLMVKELRRYGIIAILTTPERLTVDVINNYLELKSRQLL